MSQDSEQAAQSLAGQVLEFDLGSEAYCVDIQYVTEIVNPNEITETPQTPAHVMGIMDLRGTTTTIVDPKQLLRIDDGGAANRVVVFEPSLFDDGRPVGWLVDRTRRVTEVSEDEVDEPPDDDEFIRGIVKLDGGFVVWIEPPELHG